MESYAVSSWIIWTVLIFIFILLGCIVFLFVQLLIKGKKDSIIMFDKNMRWKQFFLDLKGHEAFEYKDGYYPLQQDLGSLNSKGKVLYIFNEGKPTPLKLTSNDTKWWDAKTLQALIHNKMAQQIVKPTDKFVDMLIIMGAIGGIIAGLSSAVILLIQLGVIKPS